MKLTLIPYGVKLTFFEQKKSRLDFLKAGFSNCIQILRPEKRDSEI